jgi:hypothetical protein
VDIASELIVFAMTERSAMRKIGFWVSGLVVLVASFLVTNWILSINEGLNWKFTDEASLAAAAKAAGYSPSADLAGHVDNVSRIDGKNVAISGWALDISGDGSPLDLTAFIDGGRVATFHTEGSRPDIAVGMVKANPKANPESAKNTRIESKFSCAAGDNVFIVVTTRRKNFLLLQPYPLICP